MAQHTHGRCRGCNVIFRWPKGRWWPLRRDAACPRCGRDLQLTAARLAKRIPVVEEVPLTRASTERALLLARARKA